MEIINSSLICDNKNAKKFSLLFVKLIVKKKWRVGNKFILM